MDLRTQLDRLGAADDLAVIDQQVTAADEPVAVAAEAARVNGPALLFDTVPGEGRLAAGVRGGPDQTQRRDRYPRSRLAEALGFDRTVAYTAFLDTLRGATAQAATPPVRAADASRRDMGIQVLALPRLGASSTRSVTTGLVAATAEGTTRWAPIRGSVVDHGTIHASVPEAFAADAIGTEIRLAMGVPTAALVAAHVTAGGRTSQWEGSAPEIAAGLADVPVTERPGPSVPASSEVVVDGTTRERQRRPGGRQARWEAAVPTTGLEISVDAVATRPDPIVPVVPLGEPLADDVHVSGLVETAHVFDRVDNHWGVSAVEWVRLPVETGLGFCLIASEILYAGFEWQLANTLFTYSSLFDKVLVLDADCSPDDLAGAFDDIWVKAHPARNWTFSEPNAPAPTAPHYRADGQEGVQLYVNATWDPTWDEYYIAPAVEFETMYPEDLQRSVRERWAEFGFDPEDR